ncbi:MULTISPECIES: HD domain-containing protein [Dethiosulfovibrio]|uniref:HD Cas3-type domain-containing protein n=2 Tax=Dethiosulfovibrio TaxID=47054 RepID=A0ABS9EQR2_9BACT|nr:MULTISPECIES: HD domain-containing protein [Dethiosulfovibrio]MCF4114546.1 hypothetical protein [Dethiosulfovibrio russensis]MCF4143530.1 hypothetical protein [Dethiosulfovibrio marinus]MCF4145904.1 hypothetical protein [Dethiosulfovibrio acidaminovorans]
MAFIDDELFRYWGKFEGDRWHPLVYHCLDVASVALRWLNNTALNGTAVDTIIETPRRLIRRMSLSSRRSFLCPFG